MTGLGNPGVTLIVVTRNPTDGAFEHDRVHILCLAAVQGAKHGGLRTESVKRGSCLQVPKDTDLITHILDPIIPRS